MRILLPPSEGKSPPESGPRLDIAALPFPALHPIRRTVLDTLTRLCRTDPDQALGVLGLSAARSEDVRRNAALAEQPCAPAAQVYTGVLYAALDLPAVPQAGRTVLIASGLFGLLRPDDPIPAYRLSGSSRLPGLATPRRVWAQALAEVLEPMAQEHLMVDLRSQAYAGLWRGDGPQWAAVRIVTLRGGRRVAVSHHNKATKGALARSLVDSGESPADIGQLRELLGDLGWEATVAGPVVEVMARSAAPSLRQ